MYALRLATLAVAATAALTATGVRIGNHRAYVRVVVGFKGKLSAHEVQFDWIRGKTAALHISHPGIETQTTGRTGDDVRVALQPATQGLNISASFWSHRFAYVSYAVVGGNRLVIDLWKSVLRGDKPIRMCSGLGLALQDWSANGSEVKVSGHEHGLFENQFQVVIRRENGLVVGRKTVTGPGSWTVRVPYHVAHSQPGTLEAVALSPKDGSLACIAELGINLPAT